jgi:hypothetical protein
LTVSYDHRGRLTWSEDRERVVAEAGQDMCCLTDDAPGLGQRRPVAVVALAQAWAGAKSRAEVLAASNSSQRRTSGPCRDRRPGLRLLSEERTVMSRPTNLTALREDENRFAPPSQATGARLVIGPTP